MGILLLLVGLLGLVSGGLKLRNRFHSRTGLSPLASSEIAVGASAVIGASIGLSRSRPLAWTLVAGALALIVASTAAQVRRTLRHRRRQGVSEGERLRNYLRSRGTPVS
jgi:peptidoglycan biosynthesis protein MviN/MurJ (putative lipid II flippase)